MSESCEWNPTEDRPSSDGDGFHADAVWSVGRSKNFHLCDSCAKLPAFRRSRSRVWIGPKKVQS